MLVLTRKPGEKIRIGEDIEITVISISGNRVKLGIDAPSEVGIRRSEVEIEISTDEETLSQDQEPESGAEDSAA